VTHYKEADYYDLLEVRPDAVPAEIEEAYKRQMELLSGDSLATYGLFVADDLVHFRQRVEEAHRVLSDPARRRAYDVAAGHAPEPAEAEAVAAAEPLVAREAVAGDEPAATPVATAGPPPEEDVPAPEEAAEAVPPVEHPPEAPRVPEAAALPPFGPSGPQGPATPPAEAPAGPEAGEAQGAAARTEAAAGGERFDGPAMRAVREKKRITLSSISQNTRIAEYYLEYIEAERFDSLPPPIYLRSYIRQYAAAIGVDEDRAVEGFLARYNDARNGA
jgi:hypothetical protein